MAKVSFSSKGSPSKNGAITNLLWHTWVWEPIWDILLAKTGVVMYLVTLKTSVTIQSKSTKFAFIGQVLGMYHLVSILSQSCLKSSLRDNQPILSR